MRILFQLIIDDKNLKHFSDLNVQYLSDDYKWIDFIGLSKFWIIDEYGNLIISFENLLLDFAINFALNFNSLNKGQITVGRLFVMEPEWDYHFEFFKKNNKYIIKFKNHKDIIMDEEKFGCLVKDFSFFALATIEYFYKGINKNPNYIKLKNDVYEFLA